MKGYMLSLLIAAILLLLLPIPALFIDASSPKSNHFTPSTDNAALSDGDQFRLLVDDEVVTLDVRDFLIRTLAFEMSPTYHSEALKAQAVAAYTYYGRRRLAQSKSPDPTLKGAHFKTPDDRFPQDYTTDKLRERWGNDFDKHYQALAIAVEAVLGKHMTYQDEWIDACYFAISHGTTESAHSVWGSDVPYLRSVASPVDKLAGGYQQTVSLTPEAVKKALLSVDPSLSLNDDPSTWFGNTEKNQTGSLKSITIGGKKLTATTVRTALDLRSTHFTVTVKDGQCHFTTLGYGHGVGMSQHGANALAQQGFTWQEILQYYYTDITIV